MFDYSAALMKGVPASYARAHGEPDDPIDLDRALRQHSTYRGVLESLGLSVTVLAASNDQPDSVFIEDPVLVCDDRALITRPVPRRGRETREVEDCLEQTHELERIEAPARLEGGDVVHTARETFVGLSRRTNEAGARQLQAFLAPEGRAVRPVEIETGRYLHLKSGASYLGDGVILAAPGIVDRSAFGGYEVVRVPEPEWNAANALRIGDTVIVPAGRPRAAATIEEQLPAAVELRAVDISEFEKGGGALSCLSVLW